MRGNKRSCGWKHFAESALGTAFGAAAVLCLVAGAQGAVGPVAGIPDAGAVPPRQECGVFEARVDLTSVLLCTAPFSGRSGAGGGRDCPPVVITYSDADSTGGEFIIEGGFVEEEIAAASYTVPASEFPIIVNVMEMVFAQNQATETTTTHWSVLVWQGTPDTGALIAEYSSDDGMLPYIVMPPSSEPQGMNVQVVVDPDDPEQIVVQDDGSHTFSVGFRIDQHHQPASSSCCLGLLPPECCPPGDPPGSWECDFEDMTPGDNNVFPTVDTNGAQASSQNWLYCRDGCPWPACPGGWHDNEYVGMAGDWNIRVTYTPFECPGIGACCLEDPAACESLDETNCAGQGGTWQGEGVSCSPNPCPGACCAPDQTCTDEVLEATCEDPGYAFFQGQSCGQVTCPQPTGACCDFSTETCLPDLTEALCTAGDGVYQGHDITCEEVDCTVHTGACCVSGGCVEVAEDFCISIDGLYAGDDTVCPDACDNGACCMGTICIPDQTEANCASVSGEWQGPLTGCVPNPCCAGPVDLNCDGDVDLADFVVFVGCLAGPDTAPPQDCIEADLDGDQDVDLADYQVFAIEYAAGQ